MIINNNSVEQINVALLDIEKRLSGITLDSSALKTLESAVDNIKRSLNETKSGLTSGETYNINISGNASTASYATEAGTTDYANSAGSATTADKAEKDADNNIISATYQKVSGMSAYQLKADMADYQKVEDMVDYQKVSDKDSVAGYVHCDKTANGTYILVATVNNGVVTYSWQART